MPRGVIDMCAQLHVYKHFNAYVAKLFKDTVMLHLTLTNCRNK